MRGSTDVDGISKPQKTWWGMRFVEVNRRYVIIQETTVLNYKVALQCSVLYQYINPIDGPIIWSSKSSQPTVNDGKLS